MQQFSRRALLLASLVGLQSPSASFGYDALHMVDLQKVICSDEGYVDVELDQTQISAEAHKPHIVTFLRTTTKQTIITYSVVNSGSGQWPQGAQAVTLGAISGTRRLRTQEPNEPKEPWLDSTLDDDDEDVDLEELPGDLADARRLASSQYRRRSRGSARSRYNAPRPAPRPAATPRRRAPPRRRAVPPSTPRRRASSSATPAAGGSPRRRASISPRRRGAPAESGPRRRYTAATVPGTPSRYSTAGTGGQGYGYSNGQSMNNNYGGQQPYGQPYGYSGASSYGRPGGSSNAGMYMAGGLGAGVLVGAGSYYMYSQMTRSRCQGYDCCYGCNNACYNGARSNCQRQMDRQLYRDDLMTDSGFIPNDEVPWPLKVRVFAVNGVGYPATLGAGICPLDNCTNETGCVENSTEALPELYVTLTAMEPLADSQQDASGAHSMGVSFVAWPLLLLLGWRAVRRAF